MRYIVTKPVPDGTAWWNIVDTQSHVMPSFPVVTFFEEVPEAGKLAHDLCEHLNKVPA